MVWHGFRWFTFFLSVVLATEIKSCGDESTVPDRSIELSAIRVAFFETRIRPLLSKNCYTCHSTTTNSQGGLRIDDRNALLEGGGSGPAVVPGEPESSLLIKAVEHAEGVAAMPPKSKLLPEEIEDLKKWIRDGGEWPNPVVVAELGTSKADYGDLIQSHWAWQPIRNATIPTVVTDSVSTENLDIDPIDLWIQTSLRSKGLKQVEPAVNEDLIRRVTLDLTGRLPTMEEVDEFLASSSSYAYEQLVDRLLSERAFAEKWGRHWLDVARYGESTGSSRNLPLPHAWRYRNYVIDSFAKDKPFNQFILEQIAGDLLPHASEAEREDQLTATGFLAIGVKDVNQRYKIRYVMDNVDEQIDAVTRGFLALTVNCARCHDHKFDPIPTQEYYALAGIFKSTEICDGLKNRMGGSGLAYYDTKKLITIGEALDVNSERMATITEAEQVFKAAQKEFQSLRNDPRGDEKLEDGRLRRAAARQAMNKAQEELVALTDPATHAKVVLGVRESSAIEDTEVRHRGEAELIGKKVERGFLSLAAYPEQPAINRSQSGRLELAHWIANDRHPLTTRVIVNRIWKHLFGSGIVVTVDNFGVNGATPTHPELLDHLAVRFQGNGWSIKSFIRAIVLTKTYRLSSDNLPENFKIDPENKMLWRHSPRRMSAEELRDSMLAISGRLDDTVPSEHVSAKLKVIELTNNGPVAREIKEAAANATFPSVYLPLVRGVVPATLDAFDFTEQGTVTGARSLTTVPTQSLYLLNSAFVRRNSLEFARKLLNNKHLDDQQRVYVAFRSVVGRTPTSHELNNAMRYVREMVGLYEMVREIQQELSSNTNVTTVSRRDAAAVTENNPIDAGQIAIASSSITPAGSDSAATAVKASDSSPKPPPPINPDQVVQEEPKLVEERVRGASPDESSWMSFVQALFGSAEFRYVK